MDGREATLLVWSPDYDGKGKAGVGLDDGRELIVAVAHRAALALVDTVPSVVYTSSMSEVGVRELRNNLRAWLERAAGGDDVVVTDRGRPIARISGASTPPLRDRLIAAGS